MYEIINKNLIVVKKSELFNRYMDNCQCFNIPDTDETTYFSNKEKGILFIFNKKNILTSIHLFGEGNKDYNLFDGKLPFDFNFSDSKSKVYDKYKKFEIEKGGGDILPILGKSNEWCIFIIEGYSFRFEFKEDKIVLITISK